MSGRAQPNQPPQGGGSPPPANQPPASPPGKRKVRIRKGKRWVEVEVDDVIQKGRFKYVKFTDDDGFETYWVYPE